MASEAVPRLVPHDFATEQPVQQTASRVPDAETGKFNPYLAARREWDERYGDLITRARNWRMAAFLALGVAVIETGGMVAHSMRSKVVPLSSPWTTSVVSSRQGRPTRSPRPTIGLSVPPSSSG